ncbi:unnamed protein product [Caenorhabditis angaria]|uniref:Uncharacterized protein n=1 Tax=Caenorhabditis angaria TaxID=860376 RepID=A0A9P1IDA8_9PELO|nr:unnamed protein product [Caenorhabditis angaria]
MFELKSDQILIFLYNFIIVRFILSNCCSRSTAYQKPDSPIISEQSNSPVSRTASVSHKTKKSSDFPISTCQTVQIPSKIDENEKTNANQALLNEDEERAAAQLQKYLSETCPKSTSPLNSVERTAFDNE